MRNCQNPPFSACRAAQIGVARQVCSLLYARKTIILDKSGPTALAGRLGITIKMKKVVLVMLSLLLVAACLPISASATDPPVKISDINGLKAIENDPTGSYILTTDIDLTGVEWGPLCVMQYPSSRGFSGTLDGNGHTITGLTVTDFDDAAGLFSSTYQATIKNLEIEGASVSNSNGYDSAILVGMCEETRIENCRVSGTASGEWAGGLVGTASDSSISNCLARVTLSAGTALGGLAAATYGSTIVTYCYAETINASPAEAYPFIGSLIGDAEDNPTFTALRYLIDLSGAPSFGIGEGATTSTEVVDLSSSQIKNSANFPGFDPQLWSFGENGPELVVFDTSTPPMADPPTNPAWNGGTATWGASPHAVGYILNLHLPKTIATDEYVPEVAYTGSNLSHDLTARMQAAAIDFFDSLQSYDWRARLQLYFSVQATGDGTNYLNSSSVTSGYVNFYYVKSFDDELTLRLPVGTSFEDAGLPPKINAKATGLYSVMTQIVEAGVTWDEAAYDSSQAGSFELAATGYTLPFNIVAKSAFADMPKITLTFYDAAPATPLLVADPASLSFGGVEVGDTLTLPLSVTGSNLTGDITYTLADETGAFSVTRPSGWSTTAGGPLEVTFTPAAAAEYSATLTFTSPGAKPATVRLTGAGSLRSITYESGGEGGSPQTGESGSATLWLAALCAALLALGICTRWAVRRRRT